MPFEIPENWCWVTGNDIFNAMISCKPQGDEFKYIDIDSIDNKNHRIISPKILKVKNAPSRASRYTQPGDVLFSMVRPYLKNIALVEEGSCIASTGFFVCSPMQLLTSEYCYYMMLSDYVVYGLNQYMKGDNSPSINNGHITSWLYPIPPINEQLRITTEIKKWFVFIDDLESGEIELESLIKQVKSKILDLAITGKLVPQDPNDEPAIELLKRINPDFQPCDNSHYENLPQGWAVCRLSDMVRIQNGFAFQSAKYIDVGIRIIRITNVQSGYIIDESPKFYPHNLMEGLDEYNLKNGDLLMSLTGNVGRVGIMPENLLPAALNQRVCCLKPKNNDIDKMYLFYYFQAEQFIQDCIASGKGVAQLNVSTEWLKHYIIQLPPKEEQSRIVKTIDALFSIIDKITAEL